MKPSLRLAWTLLGLAALTGCAKLQEKFGRLSHGGTIVNISTGRNRAGVAPLVPILGGGLVVYAIDSNGIKTAVSSADESLPLQMQLPNGSYSFVALGWDTVNLSGSPRCGKSAQTYLLTGATTDVTIAMSPTNCGVANDYSPSSALFSGNFLPLQVVFCAVGTNLAGFTSGSDCTGGKESAMFAKGNPNASVMDAGYFSSIDKLIYIANPVSSTVKQLYVDTPGANDPVRLSPPPPASSTGVTRLEGIEGTSKALFLMDQGTGVPVDLFLADLSTKSLTKISHASMPGGAAGVKDFLVSRDGAYVIFVSDANTAGKFDLFSVNVNSATITQTQISGTRVSTSAGIQYCATCSQRHQYMFEVSPSSTNPLVIYAAEQDTVGKTDVYVASLTGNPVASSASSINGSGVGSVPTGTIISGAEVTAGAYADLMLFTYDGNHLLYHLHTTAPAEKIYSIDISYSAAASTITTSVPLLITAGPAVQPYFHAGESTPKVLYYTKPASIVEIHSVDMSSPGSTNFGAYNGLTASEFSTWQVKFVSNDSTAVMATGNSGGTAVIHLFSVTTSPSANWTGVTYTDYSGLLSGAPQKIYPTSPGGGEPFLLNSAKTKIIYASDRLTSGIVELFYADIGTSGSTAISGTISAAANSVNSYALTANDTIYFGAAKDVASRPELYTTSATAGPTVTRLGSSTYLGDVTDIGDYSRTTGSNLFFKAHPLATPSTGAIEGWLYNPTSGSFQQIVKLPDGTIPGLGRAQVSVMTYGTGTQGPTPAFTSTCMGYGSGFADGSPIQDTTSHPIRLPVGASGTGDSPFAVAVDVFPLATGCSGPSRRYFFPKGLINGASGIATNLQGDGTANLRLFIADH